MSNIKVNKKKKEFVCYSDLVYGDWFECDNMLLINLEHGLGLDIISKVTESFLPNDEVKYVKNINIEYEL